MTSKKTKALSLGIAWSISFGVMFAVALSDWVSGFIVGAMFSIPTAMSVYFQKEKK